MSTAINALPYAYIRGKIVPIEQATVSIMTHAFNYGTAVFGGIRGYTAHDKSSVGIFRIDDHIKRLYDACKIMRMPKPLPEKELKNLLIELVKKNKPKTDFYVRTNVYNSSYNVTPNLHNMEFDLSIYIFPLGEYLDISKGLRAGVSSWTRVSDNMIPSRSKASGGYINSSLARQEAELNGFDEAVVLDRDGHVTEGSSENIFLVRDGILITPTLSNDILEGVTRRSIIELAKDLEIPIEVRTVDRSELYVADEAFYSGTGAQVAWISSVDHRTIGDGKIGPITKKLQETFFNVVRGKDSKYSSWLTRV